jgi:hypothetical protein
MSLREATIIIQSSRVFRPVVQQPVVNILSKDVFLDARKSGFRNRCVVGRWRCAVGILCTMHAHSLCNRVCALVPNEIPDSMAGNENFDPSLTAPISDVQDLRGPDAEAGSTAVLSNHAVDASIAAPSADCSAVGIVVPVCQSAKQRMPRKSPTFGGINSKRRKDEAAGLVSPRAWMSCKQQGEIEGLYELWGGKLRGR